MFLEAEYTIVHYNYISDRPSGSISHQEVNILDIILDLISRTAFLRDYMRETVGIESFGCIFEDEVDEGLRDLLGRVVENNKLEVGVAIREELIQVRA